MSHKKAEEVIAAMDERAKLRKQRDAEALERKKAERQAEVEKAAKMYDDLDKHLLGALHDKHTPIDIEKTQLENENKLENASSNQPKTESQQNADKANQDGADDKK